LTTTENKPNVPPRRDGWDNSPLSMRAEGGGAVRLQMPRPRTQQFLNRDAVTHEELRPPQVVVADVPTVWRGVSVIHLAIVSVLAVVWGGLAGWWMSLD
jgi:hypothetical protein